MTLGIYPKSDGEIYYGRDANMAYYQAAFGTIMNHASVNVTNTATTILAANTNRQAMIIKNNGTATVYISFNAGLTISDGYPLQAGESIYLMTKALTLYGITSATTEDVRYLEVQ